MLAEASKFWRLGAEERLLFLHAAALLCLAAAGLQLTSLRRVQRWLEPSAKTPRNDLAPLDAIARARSTARIVDVASRRNLFGANCLARSLVLRRMLLCQGLQADLRVGVRKTDDGSLDAHAWVEYAGQPLIDAADVYQNYQAFARPVQPKGELAR